VIHVSPLKRSAIDALIRLERDATPYPWTTQNLRDSFEASANCHLIERNGEPIGYYVVQRVLDEAELLNIVVFKPFQSRGLGFETIRKLKLELAGSGIKKLFLEVRASNAIATALYEKMGFEVVHTRRNYYRLAKHKTEDALIMRCFL
jgi:ribosomal-protein-alanine N-acetyltransferase